MIYVDANFFIYAAGQGENASSFRRFISEKIPEISTSYLTIDEVAWAIMKASSAQEAAEFCSWMLECGVNFLGVDREIAVEALSIMRIVRLKPRDALHAATMRAHGIETIVSEDKDFDKLPGVKRIWFRK